MSSEADEGGDVRDVQAELEQPEAGEVGYPVDARCINCKQIRTKLAPEKSLEGTSFRHVCHNCKRTTWWNVVRVISEDLHDVEPPRGDR